MPQMSGDQNDFRIPSAQSILAYLEREIAESTDAPRRPSSAGYVGSVLEAATHPEVIAFIDHWRSCARGSLPSRADFEPRRVARWLASIFLMELKGGRVRYRVVGTHLESETATAAQGRFVSEIFTPEATEASLKLFRHTLDIAAPVILRLRFTGLGIERVEFEGVQAPIFAPDRKDMWIVGCMYPLDDAHVVPRLR
jgi:hypothetical protein